jgi:hypothetical protein
MEFEVLHEKKVEKEMIPQVISRIFSICKTDKNFPLRNQIGNVDAEILSMKRKLIKQSKLFKQSKELAHELNERLNLLEDRNAGLKERLLENLGSEL